MSIDSHTHLDALEPDEYQAALAAAKDAGVELIVTVGMDTSTSARGVEIAESDSAIFAAVGIHPWMVQDHDGQAPIEDLERLAAGDRVVAIGEIGLDFVDNIWLGLSYRDPELQRLQQGMFREQVRLAVGLGLPVIVHSRGAHADSARIMAEEGIERVGGCVQFFEGGPEDVERFTGLGLMLSVGSSVTHPDPGGWYDTVRAIPDDVLVLETDAPWLPHADKEGGRSAPADLVPIGRRVAAIRDVPADDLFRTTTENIRRAIPRIA